MVEKGKGCIFRSQDLDRRYLVAEMCRGTISTAGPARSSSCGSSTVARPPQAIPAVLRPRSPRYRPPSEAGAPRCRVPSDPATPRTRTRATYTWPNNTKEEYTNVREGVVQHSGRDYAVKIGFTIRESAGKRRRRALVIVNRYPTVEFVASDTASGNIQMAGIIKDRRGKQLPKRAVPPPEYAGLSVGPYRDIVDGPGASNGLAVICASDDLATMVQHALIRYKYRQERASKS